MDPVLTQSGLADLLHVDEDIVARLLVETDVPRLLIAGEIRFLSQDVIRWLGQLNGAVLSPDTVHTQVVAGESDSAPLDSARAGESPFVEAELLVALETTCGEPSSNEARHRLLDMLRVLGDGLHNTITRLSGDRLDIVPTQETNWKVAEPGGVPIQSLSILWAETSRAHSSEEGQLDKPHIALTLSASEISMALRVPEGIEPPAVSAVRNLKASGAEMGYGVEDGSWLAAYRYPLTSRPPTLLSLEVRFEADLERLVPLWQRIAAPVNG